MGLPKAERERITLEVAEYLRSHTTVFDQDILNRYAATSDAGVVRDVRRSLWGAIELVRIHDRVVWRKEKGWPGHYHRRMDATSIEAHAARQRAAGTRKHRRAADKLRIASECATDAKDKQRMSDAADRVAVREAMRRAKMPKTD